MFNSHSRTRLFVEEIRHLVNFRWSSGHRNLYRYQVSSSTVFFFVSYMHIHVPFIMYCSRLFVVVFQEMNCLHAFKHDIVHRVRELHLSTKFHVCRCCG